MSDTASSQKAGAEPAGAAIPLRADGAARRALLRRLMDVVALPASRGNVQDRAIAGDLLLEVLIESDTAARELCARRLRDMTQAPKRLLRYLALDVPHVAQMVLAENKALDDADLAQVVKQGAAAHRAVVASRRDVGPSVSSAIADSGDTAAMKILLENTQAKLSDQAVDKIVAASRGAPELVSLLLTREELRPAHALAMFWWAGANERRNVVMRFSAERMLLIEGCADIFRQAAGDKWTDPVVRKALQVIERRQRNREALNRSPFESLEAAITVAAERGLDRAMMDELSHLSGIKPLTGAQIFHDAGGEGLAILCKATGVKRNYLRLLWDSLRRDDPGGAAFARVSEIFEMIAVAKAQTVLRYWNWSMVSALSQEALGDSGEDALLSGVVDSSDAPVRHAFGG